MMNDPVGLYILVKERQAELERQAALCRLAVEHYVHLTQRARESISGRLAGLLRGLYMGRLS